MKEVTITPNGHGHFKITTLIRGKEKSCITTNAIAIDRLRNTNLNPKTKEGYDLTYHQAGKQLINEIKRKNQ